VIIQVCAFRGRKGEIIAPAKLKTCPQSRSAGELGGGETQMMVARIQEIIDVEFSELSKPERQSISMI
jgi:hypothetical protein